MAILFMLGWWYSKGWAWLFRSIDMQLSSIGRTFAVTTLLRTWAAPWKQITVTPGSQTFFQRLADNTISRLVGFFVRTFILIFAGIWALVLVTFGLVMIVVWPVLPLSALVFIILFYQGAKSHGV